MNCKKCSVELTDINFKSYLARAKKMYCSECWRKLNSKTVEDTRRKIFDHYGMVCVACGSDDYQSLHLDHIDGDGKAHRIELIGSNKAGYPFYRKIVSVGYPDGFQALCRKCNMMKHNLSNREFIDHIQKIMSVNELEI